MIWIVKNLWLIPALPLLASGIIAVNKQPQRKLAATLAIGSMVVAFLLSLCAFAATLNHGEHGAFREVFGFNWIQFGGQWMDTRLGARSAHRHHAGDGHVRRPAHFHLQRRLHGARRELHALLLFPRRSSPAAMLGVVIANSLLLLFISWELVGLTSYLLIGFWYHKPSAAAAAKKAFITTRIGDLGFLLGMVWLYSQTGTLLFYDDGNGCLEQSALAKMVAQTTEHRHGRFDRHRPADFLRRGRQIRPGAAARLAAGRDGRPDARQRAHSRGDDGGRRRFPRRAGLSADGTPSANLNRRAVDRR